MAQGMAAGSMCDLYRRWGNHCPPPAAQDTGQAARAHQGLELGSIILVMGAHYVMVLREA